MNTPPPSKRLQSPGEEIANAISHAAGLLLTVVVAPLLFTTAAERGGTTALIGAWVFLASASAMYLASTIYHALPRNRAKQIFRLVDHAAIYLLIAGTYTPFTLGVLRGTVGWTLFGVVWGLALAGVLWKAIFGVRHRRVSVAFYLAMGWVGLFALQPLFAAMPSEGLLWLLLGGIGYTVGVPFYVMSKVRYSHFVWHLFVLAGTSCHFVAVLYYAVG